MTTKPAQSQSQSQTQPQHESGGSFNIALHPVVIINISDHFTRHRVQFDSKTPRVFGVLLGVQTGRNIEIFHSFELLFQGGINREYFTNKSTQMKKVYPTYDVLGWYSTGSEIQPGDIEIQQQILEFNESPLYLMLDPFGKHKELPIVIYESELRIINDKPTLLFAKIPYKIETGEAERIAVDHIAHVTPTGGQSGSMLTSHLLGMHNAIKMLNLRIKSVLKVLEASEKGEIPKDHVLLRQIASLCQMLPALNSDKFSEDYLQEYNDTLLVTYLASVTKGTNTINEVIDKFNITYDRQNRRRGFAPLYY